MIDSTHIDATADSGVLVITLKCEKLSEYESTIVESEVKGLAQGLHWKVAMDFTRVELVASVGLGMIVSLNRSCKASKGKLALFGMNENLRTLLKITRLDANFIIKPDRAQAVQACA